MKAFDLERAKAGEPVCTKKGKAVRIICTDKRGQDPIIALIEWGEDEEIAMTYRMDGTCFNSFFDYNDLRMAEPTNTEIQ